MIKYIKVIGMHILEIHNEQGMEIQAHTNH